LNYSNPRSVANRITVLKKKYDLPFGTGISTKASPTKSSGDEPKIPMTPSKNRVIRTKTPKKGTPKSKVKVEPEDEGSDEGMKTPEAQSTGKLFPSPALTSIHRECLLIPAY
jgi:hypothetical protein